MPYYNIISFELQGGPYSIIYDHNTLIIPLGYTLHNLFHFWVPLHHLFHLGTSLGTLCYPPLGI